ncbi:serine/threonine-protein kinase [Polyangium aurulentum]|uniref:serine/threonine-protein kinase n=1 Tax=Polyangium aurulentum TaxID=2567896 RepID=UPI0010ADB1D4|nr:serine/threonine-protein kinase [Polyangium aurulentum]UQA62447.1 protein kinase [Polyangium aurulentum]
MEERELWERRIGTTLRGKWRLESLIGVGGMAAVYVGLHPLGRRDAIKILHPEVARQKDLRERFLQEARVLHAFRHPGAVAVLDMDTAEDGAPFLVMELLDGESLSSRAKRLGNIPADEMLRYVDEVLDVLAAAHAQDIVHRDIKLDNVFIQRDGRAKVLDFGIARLRGAAQQVHTRVGAMLGTLPYMPPEQIKGGTDIDGRADIFAVGAMMFRLVAKRRIHEANSDAEMLVRMSTEPAPPVGSIAKDAPPALCMVIDRALAFRRERRYPDVVTMQRDVRAVMHGQQPPYATERLAAGDMPNMLLPAAPAQPTAPPQTAKPASNAFVDAPTSATGHNVSGPHAAFVDAPTAATGHGGAGGVGVFAEVPRTTTGAREPSMAHAATAYAPTGSIPTPTASGHAATAYAATAYAAMPASPTNPPADAPPRAMLRTNPTGAGITAYAPTMMASNEMVAAAVARPGSSPSLAVGVAATPAGGVAAPSASSPSLEAGAKDAKKSDRKFPIVPVVIAALCIFLLFVGIAVLRGHDEGGSTDEADRSAEPERSDPEPTPKRGGKKKRDWDKVFNNN